MKMAFQTISYTKVVYSLAFANPHSSFSTAILFFPTRLHDRKQVGFFVMSPEMESIYAALALFIGLAQNLMDVAGGACQPLAQSALRPHQPCSIQSRKSLSAFFPALYLHLPVFVTLYRL